MSSFFDCWHAMVILHHGCGTAHVDRRSREAAQHLSSSMRVLLACFSIGSQGCLHEFLAYLVIKRHPVPPLTPTAVLAHALIFHFWPYASISGAESSLAIFHFQGCAMLCIATSAVVHSSCQSWLSFRSTAAANLKSQRDETSAKQQLRCEQC